MGEVKKEEEVAIEEGMPAGEVEAPSLDELSAKVEELEEERDALKDRLLRLQAEFENYRKRVQKEMEEFREQAHGAVICDILYILDNMERALEAAEKGADRESLLQGMRLIHKQFKEVLKRFGVEEIEALYAKFDPNLHQAVMQVNGEEEEKDQTVVQEVEKGYLLKGRLLRPSKVVVCRYRPPEDAREQEEQV